jgi:hypothetical protein
VKNKEIVTGWELLTRIKACSQPSSNRNREERERGMEVASNKKSFGFLSGEREERRPQLFVLGSIK